MVLGIIVAFVLAFGAGAAVDNQHPSVGKFITHQDNVAKK